MYTMPNRRKKLLKRKKKLITSNSFPQSDKLVKNKDVGPSGMAIAFKTRQRQIYANSGVKRIFSPFARFIYTARQSENIGSNKMNHSIHSDGLSQKEKSYLINSCQNKSNRYAKLKTLAATAAKENKVFSVYGSCNAVRKALIERGWIEKFPQNKMNLSKIRNKKNTSKKDIQSELERMLLSNLLEKHNPNFIWRTRDERRETTIDMANTNKNYYTIINKLEIEAIWTSKQGLCSSIKRNYWFYIEDIAEVNAPRSYNTSDHGDIEGFVKDYKITACTSLLKWILSMVANERPIFVNTGTISMNAVVFAINRCKEYLMRKQNKDIDRPIQSISSGQWNSFLKKYYCIIAKDKVFQADNQNKLPLYLKYAKFLLKEIHRYRPQLSCEGCHNMWIIKPGWCSRGRGIRLASKLGVILNLLTKANSKYVIQKYIEEPLLIHETKFDIRQYYLVTSTYPLTIWMYSDCYLKFSSQKYSLKDYHESIHLTNNAIQRKYENCKGRHADLPNNNMWDLEKYKCYLNKIGKDKVWENIIYPGMKKSIVSIMLSCQDSLSVSKNRFELYGCDFILDKEYKPWLIEINSCPDLNSTTQVTAKICPAVVSDIIKVVIDFAKNPRASTGKFERIYRQPVTLPCYGSAAELFIRGYSLPPEYFYRGEVEIQEVYEDPSFSKKSDIKAVLHKLKQAYDTDLIMKQPEEDYYFADKKEKDTCTHKTLSEYEMSVAATIITEQLDALMDRITSENSFSSKSSFNKELCSYSSANPIQNVNSVTDLKYLLKKSTKHFRASGNDVKVFNFNKLDDGPCGKGSGVDMRNFEELFSKLNSSSNINHLIHFSNPIPQYFSQDILQATSKIVSFIDKKEKEYLFNK